MASVAPYMAARRHVLMDAAEQLIRAEGSTEFSMVALAKAAGVSPATPYNVFESKAGLLFSLLNRSLDEVTATWTHDVSRLPPYQRVIQTAEISAKFYTADAVFYRPLYGFLIGIAGREERVVFMERASALWHAATAGMQSAGLFPPEVPQEEVDLQLATNFSGWMNKWAHTEISDDEFVIRVAYSTATVLLGFAGDGTGRKELLSVLGRYRRALDQFANPTPKPVKKKAVIAGSAS